MDFIKSNNYSIFFSDLGYKRLKNLILLNKYSKIFVHVDTNTKNYCLDIFIKKTNGLNFDIIESVPGEENKNLESCINLWSIISRKSGDRKSLIINLGGGVVSDIGGFVASTFKRGIDYINIPTTLLSIVDASIGGNTGIDFQFLKNQIGTFYEPKMVVVDPIFIKTLSKKEILSGYAEIFKHSLIVKSKLFEKLIKQKDFYFPELRLIKESITIKNSIVLTDPNENKERKALNYGHTLGHAIETNSLLKNKKLLHGFAISNGFVLEGYLSTELFGFPFESLEAIKNHVIKKYGKEIFSKNDISSIQELLIHDKKNSYGKTKFLLLKNLGEPVYDVEVESNLIKKAFDFYDA